MLYQCIQEECVVLQIGSSLAEELKEFLSNWLLDAQTLVFPLWRWNIQWNIKLACWGCTAIWNAVLCTYTGCQLCTLTDGGKPQHLLPPPASAFAASACGGRGKREERGKSLAAANKSNCFLIPGKRMACVLNLALNSLSHLPWRHGLQTCTSNLSGFRQRCALHTAKELLIALR